jgi:hypothetical protein
MVLEADPTPTFNAEVKICIAIYEYTFAHMSSWLDA